MQTTNSTFIWRCHWPLLTQSSPLSHKTGLTTSSLLERRASFVLSVCVIIIWADQLGSQSDCPVGLGYTIWIYNKVIVKCLSAQWRQPCVDALAPRTHCWMWKRKIRFFVSVAVFRHTRFTVHFEQYSCWSDVNRKHIYLMSSDVSICIANNILFTYRSDKPLFCQWDNLHFHLSRTTLLEKL